MAQNQTLFGHQKQAHNGNRWTQAGRRRTLNNRHRWQRWRNELVCYAECRCIAEEDDRRNREGLHHKWLRKIGSGNWLIMEENKRKLIWIADKKKHRAWIEFEGLGFWNPQTWYWREFIRHQQFAIGTTLLKIWFLEKTKRRVGWTNMSK